MNLGNIDFFKEIIESSTKVNGEVLVYGYGYYGRTLSGILNFLGISHLIIDDGDRALGFKLEDMTNDMKDSLLVLSVLHEETREKMKSRALGMGFSNILDDLRLFKEIDLLNRERGYLIADNSKISPEGCLVCRSEAYEIYVNHKEYSIKKCKCCGHEYVDGITKEVVDTFYDDIGYFEQNYKVSIDDFFNERFKNFSLNRTKMISPFLGQEIENMAPLNFLELGCLDGRLLGHLKQCGHNVFGCEVNKHVAELGVKYLEVDIRMSELEDCDFEENYFDIIFSCHVLEHLVDPLATMKSSYALLKHGGLFIANLPCHETDYENHHHLHFFSEESILNAMHQVFDEVEHSVGFQYKVGDILYDTINVCGKKIIK